MSAPLSPEEEIADLRAALETIFQIASKHTQLDPEVYNSAYRRGAAACAWAIGDAMGWH